MNIEQQCPFIPGVATYLQLTFNASKQKLHIFHSNVFVKAWSRRQTNINTTNFVLKRKLAKSKFKTEDEALRHLFIKVVGYMFTSVRVVE